MAKSDDLEGRLFLDYIILPHISSPGTFYRPLGNIVLQILQGIQNAALGFLNVVNDNSSIFDSTIHAVRFLSNKKFGGKLKMTETICWYLLDTIRLLVSDLIFSSSFKVHLTF